MTMKLLYLPVVLAMMAGCANAEKRTNEKQENPAQQTVVTENAQQMSVSENAPTVYFTKEITPESLVKIYEALGVPATGRVAVKISSGESQQSNQLDPKLIQPLVNGVDGTLVECCTIYGGNRGTIAQHRENIAKNGYTVANGFLHELDLMDEEGDMEIPVADSKWLKFDAVGKHLANYDYLINLAHFKGHAMGGFGGVLKNQSIGVSSQRGKALIHSNGRNTEGSRWIQFADNQDGFLESMAAAAQAVHNYFHQDGKNIVYIDVMNNMSVDCDCNGHPAAPMLKDMGILASTDPVALDKACLDLVFGHSSTSGDDANPLQERINSRHGTHTVEYAAQIGLGSLEYKLVSIDD